MKYDAFISYRHAPEDIEVSEQIHKRLENLRVPGSIRNATGKGKIRRVFRDQEELTVSSSLSDEILSALDESEFLIVICSPHTPESEWVSNEVSYFIKAHGRERVLPVLIEGEPKDSFPKPLLYEEKREIDVRGETYVYETIAEPFAADYRAPDAQTRKKIIKKEIFRLAAPILGCRYDDLKQRHREQRNRRIFAAVTAVALLAVAFGVYNYLQNQKILENFRKQQVTQSRFLADTSLRLLDQGDRTKAIQIALEALPKMIIIAHGDYDILQFSPSNGQIYLSDISDYITPACEIKLLDIQACYCGDMRFDSEMNRETCIAYEFASKAQINKVYAWTGKAVYYGGVNSSINGIYVLYYQDDGVVDYKKVGIISKWFAPLEY